MLLTLGILSSKQDAEVCQQGTASVAAPGSEPRCSAAGSAEAASSRSLLPVTRQQLIYDVFAGQQQLHELSKRNLCESLVRMHLRGERGRKWGHKYHPEQYSAAET